MKKFILSMFIVSAVIVCMLLAMLKMAELGWLSSADADIRELGGCLLIVSVIAGFISSHLRYISEARSIIWFVSGLVCALIVGVECSFVYACGTLVLYCVYTKNDFARVENFCKDE